MSFTPKALVLGLVFAASACSNSPANNHPGTAGSNGSAGANGAAGANGSAGANGAAGAEGTAGANGSAGASGAAGANGAAGADGSAGANGSAGATGTAGASNDGGGVTDGAIDEGAPHIQYTCPPGPFPAQKSGTTTPVCVGYSLTNANGINYVEGPTWIAGQNAFFFSNFVHSNPGGNAPGNIVKVDMDGTCSTWVEDVGTNGLAVGATGNIVAVSHKTRSVTEFDIHTKQPRIIADMYMGKQFDSPNDIVVHSNGTIYFSNPNYELGGRPAGFGPASFMIDPTGVVTLLSQGGEPNGVGLSPDESTLYIVEGGVWKLDANGVPTMKTNQGAPNADGFSIDCAGNIIIQGTNSAFGGPDGKTLIVVANNPPSVKFVQMTVPGLP